MKLNNKGFALTSIIYMLIVLFLMILLLVLSNLAQRKVVLDKIKNDVKINLNQGGLLAKNTYTVTFDPTIGQINQTSKQVTYNEPYGELPTPTREGYKFIGWRGKNMINGLTKGIRIYSTTGEQMDDSKFASSDFISINLVDNNYYINGLPDNLRNFVAFYNENKEFMGRTNGVIVQNRYLVDSSSITNSATGVGGNISYIRITIYELDGYTTGTIDDIDNLNIQLEQGDTATSYEPYQEYTSDTIVTRGENHTLYAMWEPLYMVTFDPEGGTLSETTKEVSYHEPYGELPTPTREGYTFLGWRGKNMFNIQEWLDMTTRAENGTITKTENSITLTATTNDAYTISNYQKRVDPNKTYTLSWKSTQSATNTNNAGLVYVFVNGKQTSGYLFNANTANSNKITFATPSDAKYITFRVGVQNSNNTITYSDIQLEEGNAQTTYEQYEEYIKDTIVTKQENHTLYAKWTPKYTITYDGNGATSGTTASSTHAYEEKKQLTPNGFERTGYTFVGWSKDPNVEMTNIINDSNEYNRNNINGSTYTSVNNQYTVNPPFESGETYQLFVDIKGIGELTNYFYGQTGYLGVSEIKTSDGKISIAGDGSNTTLLTDEYTKYSVHFTLGSTGDGTLKKFLLFRIFEGSSASIKNIELYKTNSTEMILKDEQPVKNLSSTPNDTITLYAIWQANE